MLVGTTRQQVPDIKSLRQELNGTDIIYPTGNLLATGLEHHYRKQVLSQKNGEQSQYNEKIQNLSDTENQDQQSYLHDFFDILYVEIIRCLQIIDQEVREQFIKDIGELGYVPEVKFLNTAKKANLIEPDQESQNLNSKYSLIQSLVKPNYIKIEEDQYYSVDQDLFKGFDSIKEDTQSSLLKDISNLLRQDNFNLKTRTDLISKYTKESSETKTRLDKIQEEILELGRSPAQEPKITQNLYNTLDQERKEKGALLKEVMPEEIKATEFISKLFACNKFQCMVFMQTINARMSEENKVDLTNDEITTQIDLKNNSLLTEHRNTSSSPREQASTRNFLNNIPTNYLMQAFMVFSLATIGTYLYNSFVQQTQNPGDDNNPSMGY